MIENSLRGPLMKEFPGFAGVKVSVKEAAMRKLYGQDVSNSDVLDGKVAQLPIVEPLLEELKAIIRTTPVY
jgi:lipid-binding SYLF domain-containing protein